MASSTNETEVKNDDDNETKQECPFIDDVTLALNSAKSQNKVLIVRCEQRDHTNHALWSDPQIVESFTQHCVGLLIQEQTLPFDQFTVLYPVIAFPCLYCINPQNGQVLQCKYGEDVNIEIIRNSISQSAELMQQQQQQTNFINNTEIIRNAEEEEKKEPPKPKSVVSKLEQLRKKAKAQKRRKSEPVTPEKQKSPQKPASKTSSTPTPKSAAKLNNYNFEPDETLDAIKFMEITRKNKLRKRKQKKMKLDAVALNAADTASQRQNSKMDDDDVYDETPIQSAAEDAKNKNTFTPVKKKRVRMAFRINNEMDLQHYFEYDDTLMDVMLFVQNQTGMTDFIFISQYPPLHIDSAYLDVKKAEQYGLFRKKNDDDEKSNESKYDDIQAKLRKTLYELNLVPSCRIFIQPKFKGAPRSNNGENALMKLLYFIFDILSIGVEYGWKGIVYILSILWMIIDIPLNMLGVTNSNNANQGNTNQRQRRPNRQNSKLTALKKDKRLAGKKSGIQGLRHAEKQDDKNRLDNGNSTMYGGDGN